MDHKTYEHSGKEYNGEKAIISLTSWKKRVGTAGVTIFNLLKTCPGFHIVLVLNTIEFPNKVNDLPQDIRQLIKYKAIEILWLKQDYKVFQKVLFTMDKYRNVPVISADDDNCYKFNYAERMYKIWQQLENKQTFISYYGRAYKDGVYHMGGNFTLFPPYVFGEYGIKCLTQKIVDLKEDDPYYTLLRHKLKMFNNCMVIPCKVSDVLLYHDSIEPLYKIYRNRPKDYAITQMEQIFDDEFNF